MASPIGKAKLKRGMKKHDTFWEDGREYEIVGFDADGNYISRATDSDAEFETDEVPGEPLPEENPPSEDQPPAEQ